MKIILPFMMMLRGVEATTGGLRPGGYMVSCQRNGVLLCYTMTTGTLYLSAVVHQERIYHCGVCVSHGFAVYMSALYQQHKYT